MKVLFLKCDSSDNISEAAQFFLDEYQRTNPSHKIIEYDLYEMGVHSLENHSEPPSIEYGKKIVHLAIDFASFDKYILAVHSEDHSIPQILKNYLSNIFVNGVTFKYNQFGIPVGILNNKKIVYITYKKEKDKFAFFVHSFKKKFIRYMFGLFGIKKINFLFLKEKEKKEEEYRNLKNIAKKF